MPASSDIYGQIQQPAPINQLAQLAQTMQVKGMQQEQGLNALKADAYQRDQGRRNKLLELAGGWNGATTDDQRISGLKNSGFFDEADKLEAANQKRQEVKSTSQKNSSEALSKYVTMQGDIATRVMANPTPQFAALALDAMEGHAKALGFDQMVPQIAAERQLIANMTPDQLKQWAAGHALKAEKLLPTIQTRNTGGTTDTLAINPLTGVGQVTGSVKNTVSPDAQLQANTSTENNKRTISAENMRAGVSADGTPVDGGGLLSPESVINAATRYNMDGTLPPNLGRGTQGPRQTAQILNEAARQAAARGDTPEAQRIAQVANKASAQALGTIEKQATMVGAFEKNFNKNADLALELSQKVDRTGAPILNKWINAGRRSVTGDADLAAFDANLKATVNEYAKIVGGGTGSGATAQGEIAKVESLLSAAQTPQQLASVITTMKRETANRMTAFEEQKTELRNSMIRPGSAKPVTPAPGATSAPAGIDPAAIAAELKRRGVN